MPGTAPGDEAEIDLESFLLLLPCIPSLWGDENWVIRRQEGDKARVNESIFIVRSTLNKSLRDASRNTAIARLAEDTW